MNTMRYEIGYVRPNGTRSTEAYAHDQTLAEAIADALYEQEREMIALYGDGAQPMGTYIVDLETGLAL